jgi:cellulose synthase/poly-beta-1,6-N-acetylglucosamine synthase-like glycosyltransferase
MSLPYSEPKAFIATPPRTFMSRIPRVNVAQSAAQSQAFIQEWTPFLLVASYFVFSTCIYMVCTPGMIKIFWFVYLITNFYIAGSTVVEALMALTPLKEARQAVQTAEENNWTFPTSDEDLKTLDLVIVAYLPNEQDIIIDRIEWLLTKVVFPPNKIRFNVLYNTPFAIEPLQSEMHALAHKHDNLRVFNVPNSKSKADNLNYFLSLDVPSHDIIAIFDCDHYPHPYGPRFAVEEFMLGERQAARSDGAVQPVDIVQGRCIVYNSSASWLSSLIAVEFDKIYAVSHPGRARMFGFGIFGGSNGYWRAGLLKELMMDKSMLTEDIDSSMRALRQGARTVHCLNAVSYEMAPTTVAAFWKQRLRWAQGWAQVTMKHVKMSWNRVPENHVSGERSARVRTGILSLLLIRELSYYLVTQYFCLVVSMVITQFPTSGPLLLRFLFFQYPVAYWFFIISVICLITTLYLTFYVKTEFVKKRHVAAFSAVFPAYLIVAAMMGIYGHARQVAKYEKWNPTARK